MYSKKERNCKDSVSSIVKFIEWTLLHASVGLDTFTQAREKERKKRKKEKDCWETFLFDVFLLS